MSSLLGLGAAHFVVPRLATGHTKPAPLPNVRAALQDGLIDGEHITAIADTGKSAGKVVYGLAGRPMIA